MRTSLVVFTLLAAGCGAPRGTHVTPAELAALESADAQSDTLGAPPRAGLGVPGSGTGNGADVPIVMPAGVHDPAAAEKKHEELQDRARKVERRREDLQRGLPALAARRESLLLDQQSQTASEAIAIAKAERAHRIAVEDLAHFVDVEQARRLAEDELAVQNSADRLLETREELAQLEMMYGESGLGDATAEIVLNRTRRRLARAEEGQRLREEHSAELASIEIPRKIEELELAVRAAEVELENAHRKAERGQLDRTAAMAKLDQEQVGLDREGEDIALEAERIDRELARATPGRGGAGPLASRSGAAGAVR